MSSYPSPHQENNDRDKSKEGEQEVKLPLQPEFNIADGGEFLDDGIRMKEQPYCELDLNKKDKR